MTDPNQDHVDAEDRVEDYEPPVLTPLGEVSTETLQTGIPGG